MKYIPTIYILFLMSCVQTQDEVDTKTDRNVDDLIMNVFLNSPPTFREKILVTYKPDEFLHVAQTKEISSLGLIANLHYMDPSCGGCWEYQLLDISDKENNHYVFPIMDAYFYNSYSGTINHSWTGEKLDTNISYKELKLSERILSNTTLQYNLNHIFSKNNSFDNFSINDTASVTKVKLLIDELLNNFILYPTYWDCGLDSATKPISECINENRIHLADSLKIYKHLQYKQNIDRQLPDSILLSTRFKNQSLEVKRVVDNLKNNPDKYIYYWFYDAIYEFEISEKTDVRRPYVKIDLINKEWFVRFMW